MSGADPPLLEAPMSDGQALMSEGEAPMDEGAAHMDEGAAPSYTRVLDTAHGEGTSGYQV